MSIIAVVGRLSFKLSEYSPLRISRLNGLRFALDRSATREGSDRRYFEFGSVGDGRWPVFRVRLAIGREGVHLGQGDDEQ